MLRPSFFDLFARVLIAAGLLGACSAPLAQEDLSERAERSPEENAKLPKQELTPQILYQFLLAEIAGARGNMDVAVQNSMELAHQTRDPRIARRATEIARFARRPGEALEASRLWVALEPDSEDAIQTLTGLLAAGMGKLTEVEPQLALLLARHPQTPGSLLINLNRTLGRYPDKDEVRRSIDRLTEPYIKVPEAHFARAHAAFNAGENAHALAEIDRALAQRTDWELAALFKTQMLQQADQTKTAIGFLRDFVKHTPKAHDARNAYARLLATDKQYEASRAEFETLASEVPDNGDIAYLYALLLIQSGKPAQAEPLLLKALKLGTPDPDASRLQLGQLYEDTHRAADAIAIYRRVTGGQRSAALARAALLQARGGDLAGARTELEQLRRQIPKEANIYWLAEAQILREQKKLPEAFALLDAELARHPDELELLYDHALLAEQLNHPEVMEKSLRKLIAARPNDAQAYNALGYSLADRNLRLDEALGYLRKAHELSPEDGFVLDSLGWALYRKGDLAAALTELRRAFAARPDPEIAAHLGEVLWVSGNKDDAHNTWKEAQKAHPDNQELARTIKRFEP